MLANVKLQYPWLEKAELVDALVKAREEASLSKTALLKEVWRRYGNVAKSIESARASLSAIENPNERGRLGSDLLLFVEAVLQKSLNVTGRLHDPDFVEEKARRINRQYAAPALPEILSPVARVQHDAKVSPDFIDNVRIPLDVTPHRGPVYNTIEWSGGSMLAADVVGMQQSLPEQLINIRGIYGLRVSGNSMSPAVKPGAIVWVNPVESDQLGYVVLAPQDPTDPRRYLRLLLEVNDTDFVTQQQTPLQTMNFPKSDWRCFEVMNFPT